MESIASSAVAGSIAALVATSILGLARYLHQKIAKRQDVNYIRELLISGRQRVMEAEDTYNKGMGACIPADVLRAAQYNNMVRQVGVALERWMVNLSHTQRKELYDALDWYHTGGLNAINRDGEVTFIDLPDGKWPTKTMAIEVARDKFDKLQSIKWLKL